MTDYIDLERPLRPRRARLLAVAVIAGGALAGCGASTHPSTSTTSAAVSNPATAAPSTASSTTTAPTTATRAPKRRRQSGSASFGPPSPLAFAKCMRANGVSSFPDPSAGGGFHFQARPGLIGSPAFQAAQSKCQRLLPGGGPLSPGAPASARTMSQLLRIAECMRRHGVSQFPDPLPSAPSHPTLGKYRLITNYKGAILLFPSTLDMQSPAYGRAARECGGSFLGARH